MTTAYYLALPDAGSIDPVQLQAIAASDWFQGLGRVISSAEPEMIETARSLAGVNGVEAEIRPPMRDVDRSASGALIPAEFDVVTDVFFAVPDESVCGWERAIDAQARIAVCFAAALNAPTTGNLLLVGKSTIGALLLAHLLGQPISRSLHQSGGGVLFAFDITERTLRHGSQLLEAIA